MICTIILLIIYMECGAPKTWDSYVGHHININICKLWWGDTAQKCYASYKRNQFEEFRKRRLNCINRSIKDLRVCFKVFVITDMCMDILNKLIITCNILYGRRINVGMLWCRSPDNITFVWILYSPSVDSLWQDSYLISLSSITSLHPEFFAFLVTWV